jgi:HPt (histidine-containing phosphotransfer) domain-containing protein
MSATAEKIVDLEHLARYTGGDKALNAEIMRLFDMQASELVAKLHAILDARDAKSWKEITHTLKGAARGIGAFAMGDAAAKCEPVDLADRGHASAAIANLEARATQVQSFIRDYLAG